MYNKGIIRLLVTSSWCFIGLTRGIQTLLYFLIGRAECPFNTGS